MATSFPASLDSLTNPLSTDTLNSPSHSGQHADANDAIEALQAKVGVDGSAVTTSLDYKVAQAATLSGTQTLTNKTLTAPIINESLISSTKETLSVVSGTSPGGVSSPVLDAKTTSFYYYSTNTSSNFAPNIRGNSGTTLASMLGNNEAITIGLIVTNGATAFYCNGVRIDGSSPMVLKWQGGTAPTSGSANGLDLYTFTVMKFSGIFMVIASQTKLG